MTLDLTFKTTVRGCARCGGEHVDLEFKPLDNGEDVKASHWAMCPTLSQPILMRVEKARKRPSRFRPSETPAFDRFWAEYPNKTAKGAALIVFDHLKLGHKLDDILAALKWQKQSPAWTKDNGQFIPHPATYLRQRRWEDQPIGPVARPLKVASDPVSRHGGQA